LYRAQSPPRRYEEYAFVLDYDTRGKSLTVRGKDGIIITAIGEDRLTLLEVLGVPNSTFEVGEKIYIGKEGRTKILSVLGKMDYEKISSSAQSELETVVENIVTINESRFVDYLNKAQPLTPRIHALELIPGIGKTYMKIMLEEREQKKFESYQDLQERVGFKEPVKHISQRILDEITGESRMNLFVKR
jgi:putative nucleotide binding protein|tara:strand:- start:5034 stop:5600 length:567 start_codon:yes stop_codon:yes gene_type:complete